MASSDAICPLVPLSVVRASLWELARVPACVRGSGHVPYGCMHTWGAKCVACMRAAVRAP